MAVPDANRGDVDEAREAFGGLVVTGGDTSFLGLAYRDNRYRVARFPPVALDIQQRPPEHGHRRHHARNEAGK